MKKYIRCDFWVNDSQLLQGYFGLNYDNYLGIADMNHIEFGISLYFFGVCVEFGPRPSGGEF